MENLIKEYEHLKRHYKQMYDGCSDEVEKEGFLHRHDVYAKVVVDLKRVSNNQPNTEDNCNIGNVSGCTTQEKIKKHGEYCRKFHKMLDEEMGLKTKGTAIYNTIKDYEKLF